MGKLQPNWSWQKYEKENQDREEQFQYQLQSMHIVTANSVNSTIDDISYWSRERPTAFTWIDGKQIYTKTISGVIVGTAVTPYNTGITGIDTMISITGAAQSANPLSGDALPLPFLDPTTLADSIGVFVNYTTQAVLNLRVPSATWNGYLFNITLQYTKV